MNSHFDVLIVGGGVVGLTAALAMAQRDYSVALIDTGSLKIDSSLNQNRVYALNKASQLLLSEMGVWQNLESASLSPYETMYVWDGISGAHIDFDSRLIAEPNLGYIVSEAVLKQALLQQLAKEPTIHLFPHQEVDQVVSSEQDIRLHSQEQEWVGTLLLIADGAHSPLRQKLKVPLSTWSYEQNALVATVSTEKAHQRTALQVFNSDGPLAFLPLAASNQCSIVWSTNPKKAHHLMALEPEEFNNELTKAFANRLGQVQLISHRYEFPLHMRHVKQYVGSHWIVLGDAAHTIHPLAGLGLNVGLADVHSWLQCLKRANGELRSKKALGTYQRARKHEVWQIILLMEGFKRLFGQTFTPFTAVRGWGLNLCNHMTPLKRLFIQHASGSPEL